MAKDQAKTILIIGTHMMSIYNHRLELIKKLLSLGYEVCIAAPEGEEADELVKLGCKIILMKVDTRGTNIQKDLRLIKDLHKIFKETHPDIILTFYTKTNIYGGILAKKMKIPYIENICGLGTSLVKDNYMGKFMKFLYKRALKKASFVFFQNKDNIKFITGQNIYNGPYTLLPGSGVSLSRYESLAYPKSSNIEFLFCSRILKEKGIEEYLSAARLIKKKYPDTVFHIAGPCDNSYTEIIQKNEDEGIIKYHGKLMDLHPLLAKTHCTVLPSYYPEGMANILLESAASCRPVITTGLPGCGETLDDNESGYIVKEKDVESLADAIEKFILLSSQEKEAMGLKGRKKMEREFDRDIVIDNYVSQIEKIIG